MARVTFIVDDCKRRTSADCSGTFTYERKSGRPPVACPACKAGKRTRKVKASQTVKASRPTSATCGCGSVFVISPQGRIPNRCTECREAGTQWRPNEDGVIERIDGSEVKRELSREEQERKDAAGHVRAAALVERMKLLTEKKNRQVIVH